MTWSDGADWFEYTYSARVFARGLDDGEADFLSGPPRNPRDGTKLRAQRGAHASSRRGLDGKRQHCARPPHVREAGHKNSEKDL